MSFLDQLEARLPGEVERRAHTVDRRRVSRAIDRALAPKPVVRPARAKIFVGLAAAALLVAATAAAAAAIHHARPSPSVPATHEAPIATIEQKTAASSFEFQPAVSVDDLPKVDPPKASAPDPNESAADLFARANRARQAGDTNGAIALYQKLEKRFASSNEATVAHVSLARLLLDRDARGALSELDLYLGSGATELREEALGLRARALGMLGRGVDEKRAWQALLAEHPDSLLAAHAKERVAALP